MLKHDLEEGKFLESKDFVCHLLNMNNETNEKGENELQINEADFEQHIVTGFKSFPFPVDTELYLRLSKKQGYYSIYRINRFKPVLFNVEIISFHVSDVLIPIKYNSKKVKKKDSTLFQEYEFFAEKIETKKQVINYSQQIMNINDVAPIIEKYWSEITSKEYFFKVFAQFLKSIGCRFEIDIDEIRNPDWYDKINFY